MIIYDIKKQNDGKIVVGGTNAYVANSFSTSLYRLNSDGALDVNFLNISAATPVQDIHTIESQNDGKIVVGGNISYVVDNSTSLTESTGYIVRYNSDGTLDNTFYPGFNNIVYDIEKQDDGKLLVGGAFTTYSGTSVNRIARLNSNGTLDETFDIGVGFNGTVVKIKKLNDGKILVGGSFTTFNGISIGNNFYGVVKLNSDGTRDTTFSPIAQGVDSTIFDMDVQNDGKIIIVGSFGAVYIAGQEAKIVNGIFRLNSDGTFDETAQFGRGFSDGPRVVVVNNNEILVGGGFSNYQDFPVDGLVKLDRNGKILETFSDFKGSAAVPA